MTTTDAVPSPNAFHYPAYVKYFTSRTLHAFAMQIVTTAVGWQIYSVTHQAIYLAYVGLAVFLPVLLLVLPAGYAADHFNRRWISAGCFALEAVSASSLLFYSLSERATVWPIYVALALFGTASAFGNPAASSIVPNVLSKEALPHGISLNSMAWQTAAITGPSVGGLLYIYGPVLTYGIATLMLLLGLLAVVAMGYVKQAASEKKEGGLAEILAGFSFTWSEPIVLGAISLDMFAVLLGGAVALLPIYASDILQVGSIGNGLLRSAPGFGAVLVGLWLAKAGIKDRAGWWLFLAVAFSGVVIVVFGYSTIAWVSILMLALYGGLDMISVYVREVLMQLWIPDHVRGRVNAVNYVFIGASNQLGEARAGFVAAAIGAVPAVVIGGFGTIAVAAAWAWMFPQLRNARHLTGPETKT